MKAEFEAAQHVRCFACKMFCINSNSGAGYGGAVVVASLTRLNRRGSSPPR